MSFRLLPLALLILCLPAPAAGRDFSRRVAFPAGAFGTTVRGAVVRGDRDVWIAGAGAGQRMVVRVSSPEGNAVFQIDPPGPATSLKGAAEGDDATRWSGRLPAAGDYRIVVGGTRGNASYRLDIEIR